MIPTTDLHTDYRTAALRQLRDQRLRSAAPDTLLKQADRAEQLVLELDARRSYSYDDLQQRITESPAEQHARLKLSGADVIHDLQLLVEDLSGAADLPVEAVGQRVLTVHELAKQLNVSTKTISRWRRQGLVSRRFVFDDRKRIGFLQSSIDRFVATYADRVRRGAQFSQLTEEERESIFEQARRLARAGAWPTEVTRQLARSTGRSVETIRYTLKQYDRAHPESAIFPDHHGPVRPETKRQIYQQARRGTPIEALAKRFRRTKTSVCRIIGEMRARRIMELPLEYVPNEQFARLYQQKGKEERDLLRPLPAWQEPPRPQRLPAGLPPYLASLYEVPLLAREQEVYLFLRMNYLKYKAGRLRETLDPNRPQNGLMALIENLYEEALATKNQIVRANLRLVVSIAKRHVGPRESFFDLVSDGNMSLMRAVEKFDFARGNKFSTYTSWAIMKNFARTIPDTLRHHDRYRTSHSEMFAATEDARTDEYELEVVQSQRQAQVERILDRLDAREQEIIARRFGLRHGQEPLTLKQVGDRLGVTKERIRQIEARALSKLRAAVAEERIVFSG